MVPFLFLRILPSGTALAAAGTTARSESLFSGRVLSAQPELKQHPAGAEQDDAKQGEEVSQHGVWWLLFCRITIWAKGYLITPETQLRL